jgi:hypothetical protein
MILEMIWVPGKRGKAEDREGSWLFDLLWLCLAKKEVQRCLVSKSPLTIKPALRQELFSYFVQSFELKIPL